MTELKYFGTDGIRGRVGKKPMDAEFLLHLGWAVGVVLAQSHHQPVILLGRDTRASGMLLQSALQAGLTAAGVHVHTLGVVPTPAVAHLTQSLRATAGCIISASHNPFYDNGVKFFNAQGEKFSDEMQLAIESLMDEPMTTVAPEFLADVITLPDAAGRYSEFCKSTFPAQINLNGLKIVVDCAHGATFSVAPMIFHELGADVISMGNTPDGININDGCGATDLKALQLAVRDHHADCGIALDGDGDRVMMVDHTGEMVDGDQLLCILAVHANQHEKVHGVVGTLMTNWGFEQAMKQHAIPFLRSAVGDRFVLEMLKQENWILGGESSGHLLNLSLTTTGDGIISALQVLKVIKITGNSLLDLKQCMTKTPQVMINVPIYQQPFVLANYPRIQSAVHQVESDLMDCGRVLLRPSGTEPLVRVMVEGGCEEQVRRLAQSLADEVSRETA